MHFLGHLALALAIVIAAMIVAFALRFTPVVEHRFQWVGDRTAPTGDDTYAFDHWTGKTSSTR